MLSKEEYTKYIDNPPTFENKKDTIDHMFNIIEYYLKTSNLVLSNGRQTISSSQIILKKPNVNDNNNFWLLTYAYNKLIGRN